MAIDKYGRIIRDLPGTQRSPSASRRRSGSWWDRFDDAICSFGNAFDDLKDSILAVLTYIIGGGGILVLLIYVIYAFFHDGIGAGILAIILSLIIGVIGFYVLMIFIYILYGIFSIIRRIFWSATSLTITVFLALAIFGFIEYKSLSNKRQRNYPAVHSSVPAARLARPSTLCCFADANTIQLMDKIV